MKKALILLLGALAALPAFAREFYYEYKGQSLYYRVLDEEAKTCTILGGPAHQGELVIPSVAMDGETAYSVVEIGERSFWDDKGLTSVVIPPSVTSITDIAFMGCSSLSNVRFEDSSKPVKLGSVIFNDCSIDNIYIGRDWVLENDYVFSNSIKNLTIGNLVSTIPAKSFYASQSLLTVCIGDGVKTIGDNAFDNCSNLNTVTMGKSVTSIGNNAFLYCSRLPALTISPSVETIGSGAFTHCEALSSIQIPDAVISIGAEAFSHCKNLSTVIIGNSVKSIGDEAFSYCEALSTLSLGKSLNKIGNSAFRSCISLTSLVVSPSVSYIGESAFEYCIGITSVYLPAAIRHVGPNAFKNCKKLVKAAYPNTIINPFEDCCSVVYNYATDFYEDGWIFGPGKTSIVFVPHTFSGPYTLPDNVSYIGPNAFTATGLTEFISPRETPIHVADNAFAGLYSTVPLSIPDGTVFDYLLTNWSFFDNIRYGNGHTELKAYSDGVLKYRLLPEAEGERLLAVVVPGNYSALKEIFIPERFSIDSDGSLIRYYVDAIGFNAFKGCSNLTSLSFHSRSVLRTIGPHAFEGTGITTLSLPSSVTTIGDYAFAKPQTVSAAPLFIPASLKTVGASAFSGFAAEKVTASDLSAWCAIDFANASANPLSAGKAPLYIGEDELTELTIPAEITGIKPYAFASCSSLSAAKFGPQVASIGAGAFAEIPSLDLCFMYSPESIDIGQDAFRTPDGKSVRSLRWDRPMDGFNLPVKGLETLVIGNTVPAVSDRAFKGAALLSSLSLGSAVTEIGAEAFSGCTALTEAILPPSVETVGASAFADNAALAAVAMGHSITSIGEKAFEGCPLSVVSITAQTPPAASDNTFSRYSAPLNLQGEKAVDDYYDAYTCWDRFDGRSMIVADAVQLSATTISGKPGDSVQLSATVTPADATLPYVFWRSSDPEVAIVDNNGIVTILSDPSAPCSIIAETLYASGPVAAIQVKADDTTSLPGGPGLADADSPAEIYTLAGIRVDADLTALTPGIYIVRQGAVVRKIAVK